MIFWHPFTIQITISIIKLVTKTKAIIINRRHNIGNTQMSIVEKAILESLDSMHDKFDDIARRVTTLERKFADMDAFFEEQFLSNDEPIFKTRKEYEAYHNNPPYSWD